MNPVIDVTDLTIDLYTPRATVRAVDGVSYSVSEGEVLAVVGESGSGKTVMNMAPLGLLPRGVTADIKGSVRFGDVDLLRADEPTLRRMRGGGIGVVFQDPLSSLNPSRKIGRQIAEVIEKHRGLGPKAAAAQAADLMALVGISDPKRRLTQYPHELSGGMRQRIGIAMGIAGEPRLLIADEPTTALDVTVQAQIMDLLRDIQARLKMAIVIVTHDMGVVSTLATTVAVMYAGRVVEAGPVRDVLLEPRHPYTAGLLRSVPTLRGPLDAPFRGLGGTPPDLSKPRPGCAFAPRCEFALPDCRDKRPTLIDLGAGRSAACPVRAPSPVAPVLEHAR
ncbi:ABC transporter ATP-binding protein [Acuticoccus kandeliae]|uniref:ABC transporter ATP-binding protein n=1 Tax=Acuticoccus kandeliae TaxID=2073160 RepID=UPI000D3EBB83|nr:ABC transporter ATP-binding protein [Acuticoccus kandeliae]